MDERETPHGTMSVDQLLDAARATMKGAEYCFFISTGSSGHPIARIMQPYDPEKDMTIYFGASPRSRKLRDIRSNDAVTLAFFDAQETAYLTMYGRAEVDERLEARRKYWRVFWSDIYPGGPEGDDYILIKFVPERMEMMNFTKKAMPQPYSLRPAVLVRTKGIWNFLRSEDAY